MSKTKDALTSTTSFESALNPNGSIHISFPHNSDCSFQNTIIDARYMNRIYQMCVFYTYVDQTAFYI